MGQTALGSVVLNKAWKGVPHVRGPARRENCMVAELQGSVGGWTGTEGVTGVAGGSGGQVPLI